MKQVLLLKLFYFILYFKTPYFLIHQISYASNKTIQSLKFIFVSPKMQANTIHKVWTFDDFYFLLLSLPPSEMVTDSSAAIDTTGIFSSFAETSTFGLTLGLLSGLRKLCVWANRAWRCFIFMSDILWPPPLLPPPLLLLLLGPGDWFPGGLLAPMWAVMGRTGRVWRAVCWTAGRWMGFGKVEGGTPDRIMFPIIICGLIAPGIMVIKGWIFYRSNKQASIQLKSLPWI